MPTAALPQPPPARLSASSHRHFRRQSAARSMPQTGWYTWHPIRAEKKSRLAVARERGRRVRSRAGARARDGAAADHASRPRSFRHGVQACDRRQDRRSARMLVEPIPPPSKTSPCSAPDRGHPSSRRQPGRTARCVELTRVKKSPIGNSFTWTSIPSGFRLRRTISASSSHGERLGVYMIAVTCLRPAIRLARPRSGPCTGYRSKSRAPAAAGGM